MIDLSNSRLFTPMTNPDNGLTVYVLTKKVAPLQQSFYFVNTGMTNNGSLLWFYCVFPPSGASSFSRKMANNSLGKTLGVADLESGKVQHYPETQFTGASPWVDPATGVVYWGLGDTVWRRGPEADASVEHVNSLPEELTRNHQVTSMATHLTLSADGREFFIDTKIGLERVLGSLPKDGGDFQLWTRLMWSFNHAQFSPTDPDMALLAMASHTDPITGGILPSTDRLWTIRRGEDPEPIFPEPTSGTHEWWDNDGEHVWFIHDGSTCRTSLREPKIETVWDRGSHAHLHPSGRYMVCDHIIGHWYRGGPTEVWFFDRDTSRELRIATNPAMDNYIGGIYHIDPHPRFCAGGEYVVFTTTVRDQVDVAMVRTKDLIDRTA